MFHSALRAHFVNLIEFVFCVRLTLIPWGVQLSIRRSLVRHVRRFPLGRIKQPFGPCLD